MNLLQFISSNKDLCFRALKTKPSSWTDNITWIKYFAETIIKNDETYNTNTLIFDPWIYVAGFPETKPFFWCSDTNTLNEEKVYINYITHGVYDNVPINRLNINNNIARFSLDLYIKHVNIIDNSKIIPANLSEITFNENDINIVFNLKDIYRFIPHISYAFLSKLSFDPKYNCLELDSIINTPDIHNLYTNGNLITLSPILNLLLWIIHNSKPSTISVIGFNEKHLSFNEKHLIDFISNENHFNTHFIFS